MAVKKVRRRVSFAVSEDDEPAREPERTVQSAHISVVVDSEDDSSADEVETMETPQLSKEYSSGEDDSDSDESSSSEDEKPAEKAVKKTSSAKRKKSVTPSDKSTAAKADKEDSESDSESGSSSESSDSDDSDDEEEDDETAADETKDTPSREKVPPPVTSFGEMALDPRVEHAIERIGWRRPTAVQSAVVPVALSGRDLLVSAPTGSGKTAAFGIPIAQQLCRVDVHGGIRVIVFVPTRELVHQVTSVMKLLVRYIDGIRVAGIVARRNVRKGKKAKRPRKGADDGTEDGFCAFDTTADILVGTPASVAEMATKTKGEAVKNVELVVMDEADLVLNYGYEQDAKVALAVIPSSVQAMLFSATLEADGMDAFRKVVLRRPLTVKVTTDADIADGDPTGVAHYFARLGSQKDRYLVAYAMLRLNVLCGKVLIFVNHINAGFRLKLFLDQFKVKTAVLNSELPANSRVHCVDQFNAGIFDVLIATDEVQRDSSLVVKEEDIQKSSKLRHKEKHEKKRKRQRDTEFGLSRGVDFRNVAAVLNFDVPDDLTAYTHRAGRTARAGATGTVLSLVVSDKEQESIVTMGKELGVPVGPLAFRMEQIEAFRYRVEDCLRMVTDAAVTQARLADVRREIVNSEKLKDYFDDNPQDLDALKHDLALAKHVPDHLAHIPSYLLPPALRASVSQEPDGSRFRIRKRVAEGLRSKKKRVSRNDDPLKSLSVAGRRSGTSRERFESRHKLKKTIKKGNSRRHSRR